MKTAGREGGSRAESRHFFNHADLDLPAGALTTAGFGRISTSNTDARDVRFALRLHFQRGAAALHRGKARESGPGLKADARGPICNWEVRRRRMRIEDLYPPAVRSAPGAGQAERSAGEDRFSAGDAEDAVYLSRLSQLLLAAGTQPARIEQLRQLFERGEYAIQPPDVSRRLVEFHLEPNGDGEG